MTNQPIGGSAELEAAKAMFSDWKQSHEKTTKVKKVSREDALKKHFIPRDEKETFRAVHPNLTEKYVKVAFFHEVFTNKSGGKKQKRKVYCPAHNDGKVQAKNDKGELVFNEQGQPVMIPVKCPLCDEAKRLLATQDKSILSKKKEEYTQNDKDIKEKNNKIYAASKRIEAKKFFMIKGIDRGKEKDGVKYWRFKFNYKQQGVADKLIPALSNWTDASGFHFANKDNGIDINIGVVENSIPGSNYTYKDVSSINTSPVGATPLHHDPAIANAWLADPLVWREVYKPLEYSFMDAATVLKRLSTITSQDKDGIPKYGTDPFWDDTDSNNKKWVFPDPQDAELANKTNNRETNLDATPKNFEQASDVEPNVKAAMTSMIEDGQPTISEMTPEMVGKANEDAVNLIPKQEVAAPVTQPPVQTKETSVNAITGDSDIEEMDLPF